MLEPNFEEADGLGNSSWFLGCYGKFNQNGNVLSYSISHKRSWNWQRLKVISKLDSSLMK